MEPHLALKMLLQEQQKRELEEQCRNDLFYTPLGLVAVPPQPPQQKETPPFMIDAMALQTLLERMATQQRQPLPPTPQDDDKKMLLLHKRCKALEREARIDRDELRELKQTVNGLTRRLFTVEQDRDRLASMALERPSLKRKGPMDLSDLYLPRPAKRRLSPAPVVEVPEWYRTTFSELVAFLTQFGERRVVYVVADDADAVWRVRLNDGSSAVTKSECVAGLLAWFYGVGEARVDAECNHYMRTELRKTGRQPYTAAQGATMRHQFEEKKRALLRNGCVV